MTRLKRLLFCVALLAIVFFVVVFAGENKQLVFVNPILLPAAEHSIATWLIAAFGAGGVLGFAACIGLYLAARAKHLALLRRFNQMEKELSRLRSTVLKS